jgi:hypothetical protein
MLLFLLKILMPTWLDCRYPADLDPHDFQGLFGYKVSACSLVDGFRVQAENKLPSGSTPLMALTQMLVRPTVWSGHRKS